MPEIHIQRSIKINASISAIGTILADLRQWPPWSPWLIQDPECKLTFSDDGQEHTWDGSRVGKGKLSVSSRTDTRIEYNLQFLMPLCKSQARTAFELNSLGEQETEVTWIMDNKLPFFMFWMKKAMETYTGMDFERGLNMLKPYAETGSVPSKLNFDGETDYPGCQYIGLKTQTTPRDIGNAMEADAETLGKYLGTISNDIGASKMLAIYHQFDPIKNIADYTLGTVVSNVPAELKEPFTASTIPKLKAYKITHTGSYIHIGNIWATLNSMIRTKEIRQDTKIDSFEIYLNTPGEVKDSELLTEAYLVLKHR